MQPVREGCIITVPIRSSISVLDMNTLSLGRVGGGNIGFALDARLKVSIRVSRDREYEVPSTVGPPDTALLLEHVDSLWKNTFNIINNHHIVISAMPPMHSGFGASSALQIAILAGLNWMYGLPLPETRLRRLLHNNYRELVNGMLQTAFTTGLSSFLCLYGGFSLVNRSKCVRILSPPWNFLAALPSAIELIASVGSVEQRIAFGEGRTNDTRDRKEKIKLINTQLLPAVRRGNLTELGAAVWSLQLIGSKKSEIALYGERVHESIKEMHLRGVPCVFMSAAGPALIMLSNSPASEMKVIAAAAGARILFTGKLDNLGISIKGVDIET